MLKITCVPLCVRVSVRVRVCVCVCACVRACVRAWPLQRLMMNKTIQQTTKLMDGENWQVVFSSGTEVRMHFTSGVRAMIDGCILFMMGSCIVTSEILRAMVLHPRLSFLVICLTMAAWLDW